jgi:hypothetical protein
LTPRYVAFLIIPLSHREAVAMIKCRSAMVLVSLLFIGCAISAGADVSLDFWGHLTSGQGTCEQLSNTQSRCSVPPGTPVTLELTATVSPPSYIVTIDASGLPPWVEFAPVSGPGTVATQAYMTPPLSVDGYAVTLVFTATTAYELSVSLEVELIVVSEEIPGGEEPGTPYDVPGGEETEQGIEFEIPFMPDFSSFVLGDVTDCETGEPIDPSALSTEFSFPPGAQAPYDLSELERVTVRSPGYVPHEITEFKPFSFSLFFFEVTLLMPAQPDICLEPMGEPAIETIAPKGPCVSHVTTSVGSGQTPFSWSASGPFLWYEIFVYDNPCGQYPPPPTPTPTPVPTPSPTPTPTPTPTTGEPVTTTAGVWEPLWERLTPAQREALAGRGLSGWGWVKAARELLGESGEEVPVEGKVQETAGVLLPDTELLARFGPIDPETTETVLPLDWLLEPGQAFIWQVFGVFEDAQGEQGAILSTAECVRYQPVDWETGLPAEPISCIPPECNIRVEVKVDPAMDGGLDPVSETMTINRDDFVPLKAVGLDFDELWWYCEPCPLCPELGSSRMTILTGKVRFEWEIQAGEGDFVEIGCMTPVKQDVGDRVIFMPPYVEKGKSKTTTILLQIIDDNPSQPIDVTVKRWVTIETKRDDESGNPDVYRVTISSTAYALPSPTMVTPTLNDCHAEPPDWKKPCQDLQAEILTPPDHILAEKEWVRLEAIDLQDPDPVDLYCTSIQCTPSMDSKCYNDDLRWTWSILSGGGRFVKGNVGRFVIYEAPERETDVEIQVSVDNPYVFQCADDVPPPFKIQLEVVKPGIRMELTETSWLPQGGTAANTVEERSYLVYKDGNSWVDARPHMCRIHKFELLETSTEPGFCLNGGKKTDVSYDLWIPEGVGYECSDEHTFAGRTEKFYQKAETKRPVREYTLKVECEDYGAWAFIKSTANAPYESVPWKTADVPKLNGRGLKREFADNRVTIPFDADENHIPDRGWDSVWTALVRAAIPAGWALPLEADPADPKSDTDPRPASNFAGDGLAAYEEYRGFLSRKNHVRLSQGLKELFIYDPDGLAANAFYTAVTGVPIVYISNDEWTGPGLIANSRREINPNRTVARSCGAQHGLHVVADTRNTAPLSEWGLTDGPGAGGPPGTADPRVNVYTERIRLHIRQLVTNRGGNLNNPLTAIQAAFRIAHEINVTTVHEIGHGSGFRHHNPVDAGDKSCVMRYYTAAEYNDVGDLKLTPWPTTFCNVCDPQLHIKDN